MDILHVSFSFRKSYLNFAGAFTVYQGIAPPASLLQTLNLRSGPGSEAKSKVQPHPVFLVFFPFRACFLFATITANDVGIFIKALDSVHLVAWCFYLWFSISHSPYIVVYSVPRVYISFLVICKCEIRGFSDKIKVNSFWRKYAPCAAFFQTCCHLIIIVLDIFNLRTVCDFGMGLYHTFF